MVIFMDTSIIVAHTKAVLVFSLSWTQVGADGRRRGGPFKITVSSKIRVEDLRVVIRVRRREGFYARSAPNIQAGHTSKVTHPIAATCSPSM